MHILMNGKKMQKNSIYLKPFVTLRLYSHFWSISVKKCLWRWTLSCCLLVVFKSQTGSSYQFLILCGLMSVCNPLFVFALISVCEILWFRSVYTDSGSCNPDTRSCLVILQWQQNATAGVHQISEPDNTCLSLQIVGRTETVPVGKDYSKDAQMI